MRVRITRSFVEGRPVGAAVYNPGQELDVTDARGVELLRLGVAERVEPVPETAALNRGERAVRSARPVPVGGRS
jgi:hypothetical protein